MTYVVCDWLAAAASWTVLFAFRKMYVEPAVFLEPVELEFGERYAMGLLLVPLFWVVIYGVTGMYQRPMRRHRLLEFSQVGIMTLLGSLVLFFALLLDDSIGGEYAQYYRSLGVLAGTHFLLTVTLRLVVTTRTVKRIHNGTWGFTTLVVGGNDRAVSMVEEMRALRRNPGFQFVGFIQVNGKDTNLSSVIPRLGHVADLRDLIEVHEVEEVIIAIGSGDHAELESILNALEGAGVAVRIIPDIYDILSGSVRMSGIYGAPLIEIDRAIMPPWQVVLKRTMDLVAAALALVVLAPLFFILALLVKSSSPGPVFYRQERIGQFGRPFQIIKFRTMVRDAERNGPQLSRDADPRITSLGLVLRKSRLDELPQFLNVLKGEMALVGPRPERAHFIDQIMQQAPHYRHLQKVRPGITSWGQVKYGYAENVGQMVQRLRFDLIYIENMSVALDVKILFYTVLTVIRGQGK